MVAAARAGYKVAAFDIFNDVETRRFCFYSAPVDFSQGGFDTDDLWRKLDIPALKGAVVTYGSGLESQPELLDKISRHFKLAGNGAETVACVKYPSRFFPLLDELEIAYPETRCDAPPETTGWLAKSVGGSGGMHVRHYDGGTHGYYQRQLDGVPVSVLFLANGTEVEVIGYNEQWLAPTPAMPFRYGGAVGNAELPEKARRIMVEAVRKVVRVTGLRGLNSMDFVLCEGMPQALEINPRLSASFDLYEIPDLFARHLLACQGEFIPLANRPPGAKAHLIHYASRDFGVDEMFVWPEWTTDLPPAGTLCKSGEPVCTVLAQDRNSDAARTLAFARASQLEAQLQGLIKHPGKQ